MADYPSFTQTVRTFDVVQDRREVAVSEGGIVFARSFHHVSDHDFAIQHELTAADFATLMSHFRGHRASSFNFVYQEDSATYLCRYARIPQFRLTAQCDTIVVNVDLVEVSA
jgi:hypothetical protein